MSNVFAKAAEVLEKYGWIRSAYGDKSRGFCALGALRFALTGSTLFTEQGPAFFEAQKRLAIAVNPGAEGDGFGFVANWNDHASAEVVIAKFKELANAEENA